MNYQQKYLKYKNKYLKIKNEKETKQVGGWGVTLKDSIYSFFSSEQTLTSKGLNKYLVSIKDNKIPSVTEQNNLFENLAYRLNHDIETNRELKLITSINTNTIENKSRRGVVKLLEKGQQLFGNMAQQLINDQIRAPQNGYPNTILPSVDLSKIQNDMTFTTLNNRYFLSPINFWSLAIAVGTQGIPSTVDTSLAELLMNEAKLIKNGLQRGILPLIILLPDSMKFPNSVSNVEESNNSTAHILKCLNAMQTLNPSYIPSFDFSFRLKIQTSCNLYMGSVNLQESNSLTPVDSSTQTYSAPMPSYQQYPLQPYAYGQQYPQYPIPSAPPA